MRASSELRDTSTRGTPTPSSMAVSDPIPWPAPCAFSPTAGRQHTTVGEATGTRPSSGTSMITATLPRSPASQCSLCAISVVSGSFTDRLEQRSSGELGADGRLTYPSFRWRNSSSPSGDSSSGSSSSNALIANSSRIGTMAPIDMPFSTFMDSGYEVSAATRYGVSRSWSCSDDTPRRSR